MFADILALALMTANPAAETPPPTPNTPEDWVATCGEWDEWDKPGPPYQIFANTYYVGTCGISAILITGDAGHVLIDTGTRKGAEIVARNIQQLGFKLSDVVVMLHSHEHYDHVGGFAWMKEQTDAGILASEIGAAVLRSGVVSESDPQTGMHDPMEPVEVKGTVGHGDGVEGGSIRLEAISTPGHTPGALSWKWTSCDGAVCMRFIYADSLSPVSSREYRFSDHPDYLEEYRVGLYHLRETPCDIILTPHPSASGMPERLSGPTGLASPENCAVYPDRIEAMLDKRLSLERAVKEDNTNGE